MRYILYAALATAALAFAAGCAGGGGPSPTASPSQSPTPPPTTAPPVPARPAAFDAYPAAVADYLTAAGGSSSCLDELFAAWDLPSDGTPSCVAADVDGDDEDEYVVRFTREAEDAAPPGSLAGRIVVFDATDGGYSVVYELANATNPVIFAVDDFNANGPADAALTTEDCGAHTCFLALHLVGVEVDRYVLLVRPSERDPEGVISAPVAENQVRFEDTDGDGVPELLFREGVIGSAGAGPQRESVRTYKWDGRRFTFASLEYEPSDLRYFKVRDADEVFAKGDYTGALALYREALDNPALQDAEGIGDPAELLAYVRFRIGLAQAALGNKADALAALDDAIAAAPETLHGKMTVRFRQGYAKVGVVASGCIAARDFIAGHLEGFANAWDYGYANPEFDAEAVCPF
ncbi:MAG: hypothetical protein HYS09_05940 [Chloroflexi bacterium]|nr:hypothetical protein [Chloroflexota bacterium]